MKETDRRRAYTEEKTAELKRLVQYSTAATEKTGCIYLTGSFGRLEASQGSDVDSFIACEENHGKRSITRLQEIRIKAELIQAVEEMKLPEFDGDGDYLKVFSREFLINSIGSREDDYDNTFTARLLLLLEGRPLVGDEFFKAVRSEILNSYWRDFVDHETSFVPAFFCNDILRLWRTFCVNYEARTSDETAAKKIKRRAKNYKLRHTRIMTCYSVLAMLVYREECGEKSSPEYASEICELTPIERIQFLEKSGVNGAEKVLSLYEKSLVLSASPDFKSEFSNDDYNNDRRQDSREFSEAFYQMLVNSGKETTLLKRLLV